MIRPSIILGPPGTGKTTRLLSIMEEELTSGVDPHRIAFCSFTKKAAHEAVTRAKEKFNYLDSDLPHFRTLHSLAFRMMGVRVGQIMQSSDYKVIGDRLGLHFSWKHFEEEGLPSEKYLGDRYNMIDGLSRAKMKPPEEIWHDVATGEDDLNWYEFRRYLADLDGYKTQKDRYDFNDILAEDCGHLDVDVAIIDEAQDLSTLQWQFVHRIFGHAKRVYIAGDDDQAIFSWSGADVDYFVDLEGDREILEHSFRIPRKVHWMAEGISRQIHHRTPKIYHPQDRQGKIEWHRDPTGIDFSEGSWLMLARNAFLLGSLTAMVRAEGIPYLYRGNPAINPIHVEAIQAWERHRKGLSVNAQQLEMIQKFRKDRKPTKAIWHEVLLGIPEVDREYYISILRKGESLTKTPRIHINTIHGVKGGEADNVILMTDISGRTREGMEKNPDSEHRVFYVGVTRAKHNLFLISPTTRSYYRI